MSVTVSYDSLISFLDAHVDHEATTPLTETTGLCLLAGGIVGRNLEDALARREISTAGVDTSTIEATAKTLLDSHHRRHTEDPVSTEILDQQLCEGLLVDTITTAPESGSVEAVADLLSGFDWAGRPTLRETLWNELDRYFRMTDAGGDHEQAVDVARELADTDPYAGGRSERALAAFQQLHTALQRRTDELPASTYLSRSHLVGAAREVLAAEWQACYPDVEWVAVDTISVLDNPTLRFIETLARCEEGPEICVFGTESGAGPRLVDRLEAAGLDPTIQPADEAASQPHVSALLSTVDGEPPDSLSSVEFIEAPDGRRELDAVAARIRELTGRNAETACGEVVIAAKDVIPYRSRIEDVFASHAIPIHIEARRPLMQTVPYRLLRSVFDLLAAIESETPIAVQELLDPLRLGFCLPDAAAEESSEATAWPVDGQTVDDIETRLEGVDAATADDGQPFDEWVEAIATEFAVGETPAMQTFIEWLETTTETPPDSGDSVVDRLDSLLDAHLASLTGSGVRQPTGPGIHGQRTALTTKHDSHVVDRLRREAERVGSYIERAVETDLAEPGWELAAEAVRQVCGSGSFWPRNADGNAVRIVNAANAHYLAADHVFVIGLAAEEFPVDRAPPTFFHDGFYQAIRETARDAADQTPTSYLHAPTNQSQFEGDVDEYRAAVSAATDGLTLCRQYRNNDGETVPWSGFVDAYTAHAADEIDRIAMDEWLPTPDSDGEWAATIRTATPRDRLRLLSATFPGGTAAAETARSAVSLSEPAIDELVSRVDGDAYTHEIEPRRKRYRGEDIRSIRVDPNDPDDLLAGDHIRTARTGPPIRLHELDLYANCQLKLYFRQYITDRGSDRDRISELPTPFGDRYPDPAFTDGLRRLITSADRLADRRTAFSRHDSLGAFRDQLAAWIESDPELDERLMQPMLGEYRAVERELAAGQPREWHWEPASTVRIGGQAVRVPGHRVDSLAGSELSIPVWYAGTADAAEQAVSRSLTPTSAVTERDHRLLAGAETVDPFGGALVYDLTSRGAIAPHGVVIGDLNPIPSVIPDTENLTKISRSAWDDRVDKWSETAAGQLSGLTTVDEPITYSVSDSFVEHGGCVGCSYRGLCQVPGGRARRDQ